MVCRRTDLGPEELVYRQTAADVDEPTITTICLDQVVTARRKCWHVRDRLHKWHSGHELI